MGCASLNKTDLMYVFMRLIVIFTLSWLELGVHGTMANR